MNYIKELNDFEKALSLNEDQVKRIKTAILKSYEQNWHTLGPNIDQINNAVAPFILTPEEGFFAASCIMSDVFQAMQGI